VPAHELRERHRSLEPGDSQESVRSRLGDLPVQRPGHPDAPFPTPYRATALRTAAGQEVRLEVYVVGVRPAEGCPDVQYDDAPVAYLDGRVVALSWEDVEWRWREWGGDLGVLRALHDRFVCEAPDPEADPEPAPDPDPAPDAPSPGAPVDHLDSRPAPSYIPAPSGSS
jgi:hypothetical protein